MSTIKRFYFVKFMKHIQFILHNSSTPKWNPSHFLQIFPTFFINTSLWSHSRVSKYSFLFLEFNLVAEKHECDGEEVSGCLQTTLEDCALACYNISSMFIYGNLLSDATDTRCWGNKCRCMCETAATSDRKCTRSPTISYNLYAYKGIDINL